MTTEITSNNQSQPRFSRLTDWLQWMESLHPSEIDLGLERVSLVAEKLGLINISSNASNTLKSDTAKVITIAGTNGKGSCVAALEKLLLSEKQSVGSYTSPHLLYYNERIKLNGVPVSDQTLCNAFASIDIARGKTSLTYFEFGTLAAMLIFLEAGVDYWLLEVGLGGRLDAVNIVSPSIAVITSIAMDHESWLGNSLEAIATEKAGILRPNIPFVCAESKPLAALKKEAERFNAKRYQIGRDFNYQNRDGGVEIGVTGECSTLYLNKTFVPLASLAAACQVFSLLGFGLENKSKILQDVSVVGRYSQHQGPSGQEWLLDVAHNPAATTLLAERLQNELAVNADKKIAKTTLAVVAMMADKNLAGALEPMVPLVGHWYLAVLGNNPRAAKPSTLKAALTELGVPAKSITLCASVEQAMLMAEAEHTIGRALVFGSFFTVADALALIKRGE